MLLPVVLLDDVCSCDNANAYKGLKTTMYYFTKFYIVITLYFHEVPAQLRTNFVVKEFELCHKNSSVLFQGNITNENGKQYLDCDVVLPFPGDENFGGTLLIEQAFNGNTFIPLFTIRENYACQAANKYLGEYWYEIERAAQIPPGVCPIRAGHYHVHHFLLDFTKISLQTFPYGTLQFTMNLIDNKNKKSEFCLLSVAENLRI